MHWLPSCPESPPSSANLSFGPSLVQRRLFSEWRASIVDCPDRAYHNSIPSKVDVSTHTGVRDDTATVLSDHQRPRTVYCHRVHHSTLHVPRPHSKVQREYSKYTLPRCFCIDVDTGFLQAWAHSSHGANYQGHRMIVSRCNLWVTVLRHMQSSATFCQS